MQIYRIKSRYDNKLNAKDLALGKINAGPQLFGMYVYGLTLGMDIIELAKIMNSPQGKALSKALQGNIFIGDQGLTSVQSAIKFLEGNITKYLNNYDLYTNSKELTMDFEGMKVSTASQAIYKVLRDIFIKEVSNKITDIPRNLPKMLEAFFTKEKLKQKSLREHFADASKSFSEFRRQLALKEESSGGKDLLYSIYQLQEWLENYSDLYNTWHSDSFRKHDLEVLSQGADEMKRLGTMLGSNKGVKSKIEDGQNFINTVEESIIKRKQAMGAKIEEGDRINFVQFCVNPEYREECIKAYEQVKHSINILQVVAVTPHMFSYLRTCAIPYLGFMVSSSKYRSSQAMLRNGALDRVGAVTSQEKTSATKGLDNAINAAMMMQWLSDTRKSFMLPKGQAFFQKESGELIIAQENTPIALWTPEGLATFKMYMESCIIPGLKKNKLLSDHAFVKGLTPFSYNQTGTRATVQAYHLTGDMMAKEGSSMDSLIQEYKSSFKSIGQSTFPLHTKVKEGSTIGNLQDAFYLYSEYVFGGRKGPSSLMTLFDDGTSELQREFRQAKAEMDNSRDFILSTDQQIMAMAQNSSTSSAKYPYYYGTGKEEIGVRLYENEEKTLSSQEKQAIMENDPNAVIRKAVPFSMKSEIGKGDLQSQHFLYPQLELSTEMLSVGGLTIEYNGKQFTAWQPTRKFWDYYDKLGNQEQAQAQFDKDSEAIRSAIDAVNSNMGVITAAVYQDGKKIMQVKNLDILNDAIEMALKHSRGEC